jgi:hypothetical protein
MRSNQGADDTVKLVRAPPPVQAAQATGPWQWVAAGAGAALLASAIVGWLIWPRQTQAPLPVSAPPNLSAPRSTPIPQAVPAPQPAPAPLQPAPLPQRPTAQAPSGQVAAPAAPGQPSQQASLPSPTAPAPTAALPSPAAPPAIAIQTADEAEIRTHVSLGLTLFRFVANPSIVVLDFASLREQGLMLNRIAALTEKGATPRDKVLNDTELDAAINAGGDTIETFYYGHDYSAAEMARFFTLATQQGIRLNPQEEALHQVLAQLGWLGPDVYGGLISVPKVGADDSVTLAARTAILRHELAHGEYFTNPAYQAYVHQFWVHDLTQREREGVRKFLASEEYDQKVEDLVENEMQAYLMFTHDPTFFTPGKVGMTPEHLAELQVMFQRGMPRGWLRDLLGQTLPVAATSPY